MNKYLWCLSIILNWSTCFSQIDSTFQNVLVSAFGERELLEAIVDRGFIETGAVYIFMNSKFQYAATSFHTRKINIPGWESEGALIFEDDKYKAYVFGGVIELGGNTENKVKNVIVFDKIELDSIEAYLVLHTTDLNSRRAHRLNRSKYIFRKIECQLTFTGTRWVVDKFKIRKTRFRSLLDKQS